MEVTDLVKADKLQQGTETHNVCMQKWKWSQKNQIWGQDEQKCIQRCTGDDIELTQPNMPKGRTLKTRETLKYNKYSQNLLSLNISEHAFHEETTLDRSTK